MKVKRNPLQIRKTIYRGKLGFLVSGYLPIGPSYVWPLRVFFTSRNQAEEFVRRIKGGELSEYILKDIWKLKRNPPRGTKLIYDKIISVQAQKGKGSLWPNEYFKHDFQKNKTAARIYGLPDGSLLIKSSKGKKLWKKFNYPKSEGSRKR